VRSFEETASGLKASDFDPEMLQKADKILETFDRDENGFLDGDEISRLTWKSPPPETSDLNRDGRLSKMELAKRFTLAEQTSQKSGSSRARDNSAARGLRSSSKVTSNSDSRSRRSKYDSVAPSDQNRGRRDRERDTRRFEKRDTPQPASSAVAKAKANARSAQGYAKYVDRSFKKYDTNSDGRLDKKELAASSLLKKAKDTDGDGFISKQEAITLVSGGKVKAPVASPAIKNPSPRKPQTNRTLAKASKSSSGKRSSLSDKDTNADGQIQMHEYTDTWTDEKLEEFREKDTDGDGLLSPAEWNGSKR
jgi:Ca2+-binding EF-hand superfamily protein